MICRRIDVHTLGKAVAEMGLFQNESGGFADFGREANARDTLYAVWLGATFGAFPYIDTPRCARWVQTLRNPDGGAGISPGSNSSIFATYCYYHITSLLSPEAVEGITITNFLRSHYDSRSGLFRELMDDEPSINATYYAYELLRYFRDADLGWINRFAIGTWRKDQLARGHFEFEGISPQLAQLWGGSIAKFHSPDIPYDGPAHTSCIIFSAAGIVGKSILRTVQLPRVSDLCGVAIFPNPDFWK
jgi:hypothetical protein